MLEQEHGGSAPLSLKVKILFLGLTGSGKTQLCYSLLNRPADEIDPFEGGTQKVQASGCYAVLPCYWLLVSSRAARHSFSQQCCMAP